MLDAAETCFRRHGFHAASMAGVAAEAGMSVGHIYRYFENKEAVIAAIVERDLTATAEQFERMREAPEGVVAAMVYGLDECLDQAADPATSALFLEVMAEAARNPKVARMAAGQHAKIREWLTALFASGHGAELTQGQIDDVVDLLLLFMTGLRVRAAYDPDIDHQRMIRLLSRIITADPERKS
ncbi:MAG TPA: TetR/AcrR family transcriptional regulator [Caulobacteraceae bacterium]|nr:TetR/AcrR family transcriptional regulator [Caulobacteraceae bacterium]